jgi:hypothetical protein
MDGFSCNFIFNSFSKPYSENPYFIKIW